MTVRTLMPGYELGDRAGGFLSDEDTKAYIQKQYAEYGIPTGSNVAKRFPWWRQVSSKVSTGEHITVSKPYSAPTFINTTKRPIQVHELRFYLGNQTGASGTIYTGPQAISTTRPDNVNLNKAIWAKIGIPGRKNIYEKWGPIHLLHTEEQPFAMGEPDRMTVQLPAPYYLARTSSFLIDVVKDAALEDDQLSSAYITLYGHGSLDKEPIVLVKAVPVLPRVTVDNSSYWTIAFDENRDAAMRDAWITHIGFGGGEVNNTNWTLQNIQFRPHAPNGPAWHEGEFFRVGHVSNQVCAFSYVTPYFRPAAVIHRPVVPYILFPGEKFEIELANRLNLTNDSEDLWVDTVINGTQEAHND